MVDKQSSIKLANNSVFHKRSKHIAIRFQFISEMVESSEMSLEFVRTLEMAADQLTKHVGVKVLEGRWELLVAEFGQVSQGGIVGIGSHIV